MKPFVVIATETEERIDFFNTFEEAADFIANTKSPDDFVIFCRSMFQVTAVETQVVTQAVNVPVVTEVYPPITEETEKQVTEETEPQAAEKTFKFLPPSMADHVFPTVEEFERFASNFMGGVRLTSGEKSQVFDAFRDGFVVRLTS